MTQVKIFSGTRLIDVSREIETWQYRGAENKTLDIEIVKTEWSDVKEYRIGGYQITIVATVYYKEV